MCQTRVKWVSSELQYADSLTKPETGQLLADRMRTHQTRIRSDENFQAAKKKDPKLRRKGAEMFAIKRPARSMQALLAYCTTMVAGGINVIDDDVTTEPNNTFEFYAVLMFTAILAFAFGLLLKYVNQGFQAGVRAMTRPTMTTSLADAGTQTDEQPPTSLRSDSREAKLRHDLEDARRALKHYQDHEDKLLNEMMES